MLDCGARASHAFFNGVPTQLIETQVEAQVETQVWTHV